MAGFRLAEKGSDFAGVNFLKIDLRGCSETGVVGGEGRTKGWGLFLRIGLGDAD
jgi:hypothetical protein